VHVLLSVFFPTQTLY